jgi:hypothetical protein
MRVAVTGAGGRLGSALVKQLGAAPFVRQVLAWDLPEHDLDDPQSAQRLISKYRPGCRGPCGRLDRRRRLRPPTGPGPAPQRNRGRRDGRGLRELGSGAGHGLDQRGLRRASNRRRALPTDRPAASTEPLRRSQAGRRAGRPSRLLGHRRRSSRRPRRAGNGATPPCRRWRSCGRPGCSACPAPTSRRRSSPRRARPASRARP